MIEYAPGLGVSIFKNDDFNDTLGDLKSLKKYLIYTTLKMILSVSS
ncbi:MAG: hypothetical protein MR481_02200 [Campylobacter sp.]|nr:hypothetical protein [Campylobacter sp.]MCI7246726.1 hypothetical protein [Campylobacter sp.]